MASRVQILLAALMFGTTGTAQALAGVDAPVAVGATRIVLGGAVLVALAISTRALAHLAANARLLLVAGIGVAVYQLAFFAAVATTGVVVGTVVAIGVGPVAAGALEWTITRTRQSRRWVIATAVAVVGIVVLSLGSGGSAGVDVGGVGLALIAGLGYALYTVLAKVLLGRGCAPTGVMAGAFGTGAVLLIPVLAFVELDWLAAPSGWGLVLYLGLVPTALAYVLFARGLRGVSAAETATLTLAEPITATLLGALVLGERPGAIAICGVALVGAATAILLVPGLRRGRAAQVPT
jgi:drug/metabolite transporter, DME family